VLRAASGTTYQLPVYSINLPNSNCGAVTYKTTDPGFFITNPVIASADACQATDGNSRAAGSLNSFKPPVLRGLAARAPYFHNGLANNLQELVGYYNILLDLNLSSSDQHDLVAFLRTL
jgi:cytochrome c peroxidase